MLASELNAWIEIEMNEVRNKTGTNRGNEISSKYNVVLLSSSESDPHFFFPANHDSSHNSQAPVLLLGLKGQ